MKAMLPSHLASWALVLFALFAPCETFAEQRTFRIRGQVAEVDDQGGVLDGSIAPSTPFTGTYVFETSTPDTSADPTVGDYQHNTAPAGIRIEMGSYVFETNPANVSFLLEIVDRDSDHYVLHSYNNRDAAPGFVTEHVSWQLDDFTGTAVASDTLPPDPPVLSSWTSTFGLTIDGGAPDPLDPTRVDPLRRVLIRGHVESVVIDSACAEVLDCIANASDEQIERLRGPQGPQGIQGPPGPPGTADLPTGTLIHLVEGAPAPAGWTLLGHRTELLRGADGRLLRLRVAVYRKD